MQTACLFQIIQNVLLALYNELIFPLLSYSRTIFTALHPNRETEKWRHRDKKAWRDLFRKTAPVAYLQQSVLTCSKGRDNSTHTQLL